MNQELKDRTSFTPAFQFGARVRIKESKTTGEVRGFHVNKHGAQSALVRHPTTSGKMHEVWELEDDLDAF